jgi:dinuclear metal center YbgI/SA1388 family protein
VPVRVSDIIKIMETYFPLRLAEKWDNVGLQIGSGQGQAHKVLVVLDMDQEALQYARERKVDMVITHHPLFFTSLKSINYDEPAGLLVKGLMEAGITVYAAHTNLDAGERGLNQVLAERVGLQEIEPLDQGYQEALYKLVVYVPADHEQAVRQAILGAGAGHIGKYGDCSFRSRGTGSFCPLPGSTPFIGQTGVLEEVEEYRLETVVPQTRLATVLHAMRQSHPYEEVAYDLYLLAQSGPVYSLGRTGKLAAAMSLAEFCRQTKAKLDLEFLRVVGDMQKPVRKIAVVSGAGASFIEKSHHQGCEVLLTGDIKYHEARLALDLGIALIDAGHQGTEQIMSACLGELLSEETQKRGWEVEIISWVGRECINTF